MHFNVEERKTEFDVSEVDIMRSQSKDDIVPFRVALMLKRYKLGSNVVARYLGKSRGLVQSWMHAGEAHALAEGGFELGVFKKKLQNVRKLVTQENIHYLIAMKMIELKLPPEYIGKHLGIPPSTVRSWKGGVSPKGVSRHFIDRGILEREFKKVMVFLRFESTRQNLPYYLSVKLSEAARQKVGRRKIGGKTISKILTEHFDLPGPIPTETITCWVDGRRKPKGAFDVLKDMNYIEEEYRKIVEELTDKHMDYHIAKELFDRHNWSYSKISKTLGLSKEKVRGWVKKDRGRPIAKCFKNKGRVDEALRDYVGEAFNGGTEITANERPPKTFDDDPAYLDADLEDEILYHLASFPSGVSSPQAIKSILIDNRYAEIGDILEILNNSSNIMKKGGRWILRE
jgi:DNA-binding transcriptional regulator YiaG